MKTKPQVLWCWTLVLMAAAFVTLNFTSQVTRPWAGFDYSRRTKLVTDVVEGSPAERAGLAVGDRIVTWNGHVVGSEIGPLYFARAGQPLPLVVERGGGTRELTVTPITQEAMRRSHLRRGPQLVMLAINGYLHFVLHIWFIGLGVALLLVRSEDKDARLASLSLAFWAGGMFMYSAAGFGTILERIPEPLRVPIMVIDAMFLAGFFAINLHFAMTFPTERGSRRRAWEVLPYVAAVPIFIEVIAQGMRRVQGDVTPARLPWNNAYSTIGVLMLLASLVALVVRLMRTHDANARRRLQLIFLSLLPGVLAFVVSYTIELLQLGGPWRLGARLLQMPATVLGSAIFSYAVIRHRLFNVRVLVRRSLQYAFARGTLLALMSLPVIGLAGFLWIHRGDSLAVLLTGTPAIYVLLILPLVLVIRFRKRLLEALDRRFFREQYDARHLLLHVVSIIRGGSDMLAMSRAALDEIDRALHPNHLSLWQLDPEGEGLHRGFSRGENEMKVVEPLSTNGTLATLLSTNDDPLDVHSRHTRALLQRLPEAERAWLSSTEAYLLVPLLIEKRLVGLIVLGERKSEEPYSSEDAELLRTLGAQLALTLDYNRLKQSPSLVWSPSTSSAPIHLHLSDVLQLCPRCGRCYADDETKCEVDDQKLVPESGVPRIIEDKYVVMRLLGRGGMGSVYLATQKRLNRPVAIKVLLSHLVGNATMRTRFEREARIVARLRHPAIVTIHDFGLLPSGHAYLVMEHLDGETLRKTINSGPQPLEKVISLVRSVGDAVDTAHRAGVIHRDLKPENIMIVREPSTPKVLDFGLAKMTGPIGENDATQVQSGHHSAGVVGTLMYMAPEILSGHVADARSDQYSLGIIAYELLAGEHPLGTATDLASVVRGHTDTPMIPIAERARVPRKVGAAIDRALSKKPGERFGSVGEFVAALG